MFLPPTPHAPDNRLDRSLHGDPKATLSYNSFLRGVGGEDSKVEAVRAGRRLDWGGCGPR